MRILGIETSSRRGSVALVEDGRLVAAHSHERPNAHAEELLPMLTRVLEEADWSRTSLDRIGVGVGPGSFTGVRVGIALAQGISLGLGIPALGVGSLRSMARGVPAEVPGARFSLLDARRGEVFGAVYAEDGAEVVAPCALARDSALAQLVQTAEVASRVVIGEAAEAATYRAMDTELPHAHWTAVLAGEAPEDGPRAEPMYVREPDAILPDLPPHPLANNGKS